MVDAQAWGACGQLSVWVQVPFLAPFENFVRKIRTFDIGTIAMLEK